MLLRLIYRIPLIGWMIRDAAEGREDAKIWFLLNILMIWGMAIGFIGYPALIVPLLALVPVIFLGIIAITAGQ
jgi:hypothetical protein